MEDRTKVRMIKDILQQYHNGEDEDGFEMDSIDALMKIERIVRG